MTKFLLDYLHKDKISVMGISWGAAFGANLVLDHPEYYDRLIAMSWPVDSIGYDNLSEYGYYQCMQCSSWKDFSVLNRTDYQVPVYVIMGDRDDTVMTPVTKACYDRINAPDKGYYEVTGGHYMPMLLSEKLSEIVHGSAE